VVNVVNEALAEAMNQASAEYPSDVDEFTETGLTPVKSDVVKAPMVAESPVSMECKVTHILEFEKVLAVSHFVIGEVALVHVKDELLTGYQVDINGLNAIGRLGAQLYVRTTSIFEMERPCLDDDSG
jgi:flavin reductase (DIM6/NTAB) family NADH-FMN oxidoreductase RutF